MGDAIGIQSYTFRRLPVLEMIDQVAKTGANAVELWPGHLPPDAGAETVAEVLRRSDARGIRICGYGVSNLGPQGEGHLRMAHRLGCDYVSIDVRPDDWDAQAAGCALATELGLKLGLHNHGPGHHFSTAAHVAAVLAANPPVFGACVDTGHFLRSEEDPIAAIELLAPRVHAVHLKDFVDVRTEVLPGTGRLDLPKALRALVRGGLLTAFVLEYEADVPDLTAEVAKAVGAVRAAM